MFKKKEFITIFIIMVTEVFGYALILPFLPFYAQKFGATPFQIGLIIAGFSVFQFFSAPIMGRLSDIYGRKPLLIISQISTLISFIILAFANSLWLIALSRIIDGLLGSNYTISQAYLSDISSKKDRSAAFGIGSAAHAIGFLVGPAIGGLLAEINYAIPSLLAAVISLLTIITTHKWLHETVQNTENKKFSIKDIKLIDFKTVKELKTNNTIISLITVLFGFFLAHTIFASNFAIFSQQKLDFGLTEVGLTLAFVGLTNMTVRLFLIKKILKVFKEEKLRYSALLFVVLAYFLILIGTKDTIWVFYLAILFFTMGSSVARPLLQGGISKESPQDKQGEVMGFVNSLSSITQILAPLIGGFLLTHYSPNTLPLSSLMILGVLVLVGYFKLGVKINK